MHRWKIMCRPALASHNGCKPSAIAVQVQLLPDTMGKSDGQVVEWETRSSQKAVPTGREGSSPSLATAVRKGDWTLDFRE